MDEVYASQLIDFGAVYYANSPPPRIAAGLKGSGYPRAARPKRLASRDAPLGEGGYVRVHVHPKRFPAAHDTDWAAAILAEGPDYVVIDKPAGRIDGPHGPSARSLCALASG